MTAQEGARLGCLGRLGAGQDALAREVSVLRASERMGFFDGLAKGS